MQLLGEEEGKKQRMSARKQRKDRIKEKRAPVPSQEHRSSLDARVRKEPVAEMGALVAVGGAAQGQLELLRGGDW